MRKYWIDNLRWVTVLLVLLYRVVYFFNNKGVFGGIGGFGTYPECPQYQDVVMYILYPWFMPLLFLLAVFTLSPLLYEILRRIPFVRWPSLASSRKSDGRCTARQIFSALFLLPWQNRCRYSETGRTDSPITRDSSK